MPESSCRTDTLRPLAIAVLTVSDTRTAAEDTSGALLVERLQGAGHRLVARALEPDDLYRLRARVSQWIADAAVEVVLVTGGTGPTGRDRTPEALRPLLDKELEGFGELFRQLSYQEIGTAAAFSRALAGVANGTLVVALPGSTGACRTAWDGILAGQLDSRRGHCNYVALMPRLTET